MKYRIIIIADAMNRNHLLKLIGNTEKAFIISNYYNYKEIKKHSGEELPFSEYLYNSDNPLDYNFENIRPLVNDIIVRNQLPPSDLSFMIVTKGCVELCSNLSKHYALQEDQFVKVEYLDSHSRGVEVADDNVGKDIFPFIKDTSLLAALEDNIIYLSINPNRTQQLQVGANGNTEQVLLHKFFDNLVSQIFYNECVLLNNDQILISASPKSIGFINSHFLLIHGVNQAYPKLKNKTPEVNCDETFKIALPQNKDIAESFDKIIEEIKYNYPSVIKKLTFNKNVVTLSLNVYANKNNLNLIKYLITNFLFSNKNPVCRFEARSIAKQRQVINDDKSKLNYTNYDANRSNIYFNKVNNLEQNIQQVACSTVSSSIQKASIVYYQNLEHNTLHKQSIHLSTGQPGFKPFFHTYKTFNQSILDETDTNYAKYGNFIPEGYFVKLAEKFLHEHQLIPPDKTLHQQTIVTGNGSTHLYNMLLNAILKPSDFVLMPRPTYGLFVAPIHDLNAEVGFVDLDDRGRITPAILECAIHYYNKKITEKYIQTILLPKIDKLSTYLKQSFSNNNELHDLLSLPADINYVSLKDYIKQVNDIITKLHENTTLLQAMYLPDLPRVRAYFHMNPHNPVGTVYTQEEIDALAYVLNDYPDICVVDDLAHFGIVFIQGKMGNFANTKNLRNPLVTLFSMSKAFCQANIRAAFAYGSEAIIAPMQIKLLTSTFSISHNANNALTHLFSAEHTDRVKYLEANNYEYKNRKNLIELLVEGFENCKLPHNVKIKLAKQIYLYIKKKYPEECKYLLSKLLIGIPYLRLAADPKGSFFYLIDVTKMIGLRVGDCLLSSSMDVRNALMYFQGVDAIPGELSGNIEKFTLRISFSINPEQIFEAFLRMHDMINLLRTLEGKIPTISKDYLQELKTIREIGSEYIKIITASSQEQDVIVLSERFGLFKYPALSKQVDNSLEQNCQTKQLGLKV